MLLAPLRSPRPLLLLAAISAPLALTACTAQQSSSAGSLKGAQVDVQDVVTKLGDYGNDGDSASICDKLFTPELKAEFAKVAGGDCTKAVDRAILAADYPKLVVDDVKLNGDDKTALSATAYTMVQKDGPKRAISLVRADAKSGWRIADLAAKASDAPAASTPASTSPKATTPKSTTP
ncbi:MAG: hypothetical protein PGN13_02755 [Patulibacter minatonensis]